MEHLRFSVQRTGPVRDETLLGRPHRVFPAVLVREQVLHNNLGRTFLPAEEIEASTEAWNGMPVVVRHPTKRGQPVSAREPHVLNSYGVGFVFHAVFDEKDAALKGEVWLDVSRLDEVADADTAVNRVEAGEPGEVSTGFGTRIIQQKGTHDGRPYDVVSRGIYPDHLALLVEETGACSVKDGCGLGVNCNGSCSCKGHSEENHVDPENKNTSEDDPQAEPDAAEEPVGAANADPSGEAEASEEPELPAGFEDPAWKRFLNRALHVLGFPVDAENESDEDRRRHLQDALRGSFGGPGREIWVVAVFSDENRVVFEIESQQSGVELFRSEFEIGEDGAVSLTDPVAVRRVTTFEPAANGDGDAQQADAEEVMNRKEMIAQLSKVCPLNAERLEALDDEELTALHESYDEAEPAGEGEDERTDEGAAPKAKEESPAENKAGDSEVVNRLLNEVEELRKQREEDREELAQLREATSPAVEERARARDELVSSLAANDRVSWSEDELKAKSLEELRKIEALVRGVNYAGRGGPKAPQSNAEDAFIAPKPYWENNTQAKKEGN